MQVNQGLSIQDILQAEQLFRTTLETINVLSQKRENNQ